MISRRPHATSDSTVYNLLHRHGWRKLTPRPFHYGAMKDLAVETLRQTGHEVVMSDLYAMGFHPVVSADDFLGERPIPIF